MENFSNEYDVVGMRLSNGQIKVVKSSYGGIGETVSESVFMQRYGLINEGVQKKYLILDSING